MIGIVNVYKPRNMTSFSVVSRIKRIYNTKHVGHLGTLDPMAEGVLVVALGKATKLFDYYLNKDKEYIATFKSGEETDTLDADGEVINRTDKTVTKNDFINALKNFEGEINQTPPKYSAVKINGQRAYYLARQGKEFEIKSKKVVIHSLKALETEKNIFKLKINCSAGTYIRSLGRDIFYSLNNMCTMIKLIRTRAGNFKVENAKTLEEIEASPMEALIQVEKALDSHEQVVLGQEYFKKIRNGVQVPIANLSVPNGLFLLYIENKLMGLAENVGGKIVLKVNLYEGEN